MVISLEKIESFKAELKDKWLDYYQANSSLLKQIDGHQHKVKDSWFVLGVITALEPKAEFKELLQYFCLVTKDCDSIIRALGLDFDPEIELKKRPEKEKTPSEYLNEIREEIKI
jgi:hypothetical protein